ncbi:MAG: hypothetical protein H0T14_05695 [Nocardioidaceae bacterium]|nr:hypothetical protein [Nocardioidaceae bacterium]
MRIGVHTGSPRVHEGGYVGMDVHRAARIAGSAHGGQVVMSEATAKLVTASLPRGVGLLDLGSHQLKDIAQAEHLFQLVLAGLASEFGPLRTLGASSSLPVPPTPLVGRDGELAELAALLESPGVRLVTLTGPGGSGKTRLAVGLAASLVERFTDGVYFVDLAAATGTDVMWTTIAEALDVPPEGRIPPGFFSHVAHRSALLVLDNLEQVNGADAVVVDLLRQAPKVVVMATSRRPLNVPGERQHAVPPLELPDQTAHEDVAQSGAVQLFVQSAQAVKSSFTLTAENAADVVAICRRLDGLPLAIELAAARIKLLTPKALLARLDTALDLKASGAGRPTRQQTLRDTIGWSHDLLTSQQQALFRRLGVFAGGADLDAITAVCGDTLEGSDPLELVGALVDANLATVNEDLYGEPRIGMLETVRSYARDQLTAAGELVTVSDRHADHYLALAELLKPLLHGPQHLQTRTRLETDHDNLREALRWILHSDTIPSDFADKAQTGLRLYTALHRFWFVSGYFSEGRRWAELAIGRAGGSDSAELARCLQLQATNLRMSADLDRAQHCATASVDMWRRLDDPSGLAAALVAAAAVGADIGQPPASLRPLYEEALAIARESGDKAQLCAILGGVATLVGFEHDYQRSLELDTEALDIARELADPSAALFHQHNLACSLRLIGRVQEAKEQMIDLIPRSLEFNEPADLMVLAEDYAAILADSGDYLTAVRLFGAADAMLERLGNLRYPVQEAELAQPIAKTRSSLSPTEWNAAYQAGRETTVEALLAETQLQKGTVA